MSKYPRTLHMPFSPEVHSDDKVLHDLSRFVGRRVIGSEKADGGCTGINENLYARSHSTPTSCPTFDYIKNVHFHAKKHLFNKEYMYFGENLYAVHSIVYTKLKDYFYLFGISGKKEFLSFEDMEKEAKRLNFETVPVVFDGIFNSEKEIKEFFDKEIKKESFWGGDREGFVLRIADSFPNEDFSKNVVKYVRKGHVQSDKHWKENWVKQELV